MFSPVSWASCSRMCRVGFGVATNAAFNVSSCLALMVVRGPRLLVPEFCSSFSILFVSLSEDVELSVSFMSSCIGSCRSGDKLLSVHDDTGDDKQEEGHNPKCQGGEGGSALIRPWDAHTHCTGKHASKIWALTQKWNFKWDFWAWNISSSSLLINAQISPH